MIEFLDKYLKLLTLQQYKQFFWFVTNIETLWQENSFILYKRAKQ